MSVNLIVIEPDMCTGCGACKEVCIYDAIRIQSDGCTHVVLAEACLAGRYESGCNKPCIDICPADCIKEQ